MANQLISTLTFQPGGSFKQVLVEAISASGGPADAGKVVLTDASGLISASMISGGGSTPFSGILSGTNTAAIMVVSGAASLSGNITAASAGTAAAVGGITVSGTPTPGQVLTATSGTAADWQTPSSGTSVLVNAVPVLNPDFTDSATVTWSVTGSIVKANAASSTIFQVNGTPVSSPATINFESGADITVSNPSAGNISFVTNLSGTYGISITGNAATATTAVTISGTISGSQVTGNISGDAASITGTITYAQVTGVPTFPITFNAVTHEWINSYNASTGLFTATQPAYSDISGTPQLAQTFTPIAHEFLTSYDATTGLFTAAQPAYTDISGTPNLSVYALLAGATFTGTVSVPTLNVTTSLSLNGTVTLLDGTGSAGTSGQVLSSTGTATLWETPAVTVTSYATTIGDGSSLTYTVTHGLNTEDIIVEVHNISTGEMEVVDVDITGVNTIVLTYGTAPALNSERVVVLSNGGMGSSSGSGGGALVLLEQHTASNSATLDFTTGVTSTYDTYLIEVVNLTPANDGACLLAQLSTDGGVTWDSTSSDYMGGSHYTRMDSAGSGDNSGETSFAGAYLTNSYTNAQPGLSGNIHFYNSSSAVYRQFTYAIQGPGQGGGGYFTQTGGAIWKNTTQATALRITFDNGNAASGTVRLYGVAKTATGGGGSSGGGGIYPMLTPPVSTNFTWHNPSSFTETTTDLTTKLLVVFPTSATGLWLVQNAALPATPYTIDLGAMIFAANNINVVNVLLSNVGLTNARAFGSRVNTESGEYGAWYITDQSWSGPASPGAENSTYTFDGMSASQHIVFVRVTNDGTNINVYWSANGENYILLETVTVVSLGFTPASTGIVFYNFSGAMNVWCYHWLVSGSILPQNS